MIPQEMRDLVAPFCIEVREYKVPNGVDMYRLIDTTTEERAAGQGVRKKVPLGKEEGIEMILQIERLLWRARKTGTFDEDADYTWYCDVNERILAAIGACPVCSGCEESGINHEIERRRVADPEIVEHYRKMGIDLAKVRKEATDAEGDRSRSQEGSSGEEEAPGVPDEAAQGPEGVEGLHRDVE